jgi:DNA-directed RNA polymerase specialized sigma24 family protein
LDSIFLPVDVCRSDRGFRTRNFFARPSEIAIQAGIEGQQRWKDMSDSDVVSGIEPQDTKHLAPEEVLEKLESLSADDKIRLRLIERRRCAGTDFQQGQLYNEAVCRALVGKRRCPVDVPLVAFLAKTMQSLASHRRAQLKRQQLVAKQSRIGDASDLQVLTDQHNPETALIEQEDTGIVAMIYECLDGDDEAQLVIMAIADGNKGKELRDEIGINQAAYDYAMRRIRKALAKKFPQGIPS